MRYRRFSPFEWAYAGSAPLFPPFAIQLWLEATDTLPNLTALHGALSAAAEANPGARLFKQGSWWLDSGEPPPLRELSSVETADFSHPLFHTGFSFDRPPIEVVAWPGAGLVFRCSHALMDARGLHFFAEEVFRALRGEPLLGTNTKLTDREYLLAFNHPKRRGWPPPDRASPIGAPGSTGHSDFLWARRSLPGQFPAAGARLAFALARQALKRDTKARLMIPVDLRQLDAGLRSTANFSNPLFFELGRGDDFTEFYRRALEAFARHDERATEWADALLPWLPASFFGRLQLWLQPWQARRDRFVLSGTVSHVGRLPLSWLSCAGFTPRSAVLLPFDAPSSALTLISIQHDHGLELSASAPACAGASALATTLDAICRELCAEPEELHDDEEDHSAVPYEPVQGEVLTISATDSVIARVERNFRSEAFAVSAGSERWSYVELGRRSMGVAAALREAGIAPGDRVALLGARSLPLVAGVLGVLRVGAVLVPLDPDWPADRIAFVLHDSGARAVLLGNDAVAEHSCTLKLRELPPSEESGPLPLLRPDSPAYLLYTSGSSGRPKGVLVGQGSFLNYVDFAAREYTSGLGGAAAVFPLFTSLAFDLTLTALFVPLVTGGEVKVFPQVEPLAAAQAILADPEINSVKLTPSHLRIFRELGLAQCGLRCFVVGGEALPVSLAAGVAAELSKCQIYNEYGPTEATVGCVVHRFCPDDSRSRFVPVGRPLPNTEVLLLDEAAAPVAPGVPGEIYLSGLCLALGYHNRPDESARFSPHPFRSGERVYRTGDRAVLRNGQFHYRGRLDSQVKVLGHRVELGEVEAAIELTGLCREAAVVAEAAGTGTRLAAYVSWRGGGDTEKLRAALSEILPKALVPSRFQVLPTLPLTVNGKVDHRRLPPPPAAGLENETAPTDALELRLTELVSEILRRPGTFSPLVSLHELGCDSLQMALLLTRASQLVPEPSRDRLFATAGDFLREPSVRSLAGHLRSLGSK